mgnify:CR=1 FL=1
MYGTFAFWGENRVGLLNVRRRERVFALEHKTNNEIRNLKDTKENIIDRTESRSLK